MARFRSLDFTRRFIMALAVLLCGAALVIQAQAPPEEERVWKEFLAWFKAAPLGPDAFRAYGAELGRMGLPRQDIERRFSIIMRLFATRPEGVEIFYDKTFGRPLTGKPEADGFNGAPSEFLFRALKDSRPGRALDAGMGQGRNAVELAMKGWTVTGFDISGEAVAAATRNAEKAGVRITAVKADYASFDFGRDSWDLVALIFAWAPVTDPAFVERIRTSLRPGGLVIFEHFIDDPERPYPPMVRALRPGAARDCFAGFEIVRYEEFTGTGDWGGPGSRLVRVIARRR
jgi:SAM-dependent methyltransferase